MLFAGDNDATFFFSFATRQRSRELPAEVMAEQQRMADRMNQAARPSARGASTKANAAPVSSTQLSKARKDIALGRRPNLREERKVLGATASAPTGSSAAARAAAKQRGAQVVSASRKFRHACLQLRPRSLPEILCAATRVNVDVFAMPSMLWLVDAVLSTELLPVAWTTQIKQRDVLDGMLESQEEKMLGALTSTERLRFVAHGVVPRYYHALLRAASEQHPMVTAIKDVECSLSAAQPVKA